MMPAKDKKGNHLMAAGFVHGDAEVEIAPGCNSKRKVVSKQVKANVARKKIQDQQADFGLAQRMTPLGEFGPGHGGRSRVEGFRPE